MKFLPAGSRPTEPAPAAYFTGEVTFDPLVRAPEPSRLQGLSVSFAPGARTHWHTHPLGQTIIVTAGLGLVQCAGGPARYLRPGDVVCFEPQEKHWHGAAPNNSMTHIALQEALDGNAADWLEPVSDDDYLSAPES